MLSVYHGAFAEKISKDVSELIRQPAMHEKLATQLMEPVGSSPGELRARMDGEIAPMGAGHQGSKFENKLGCRPVFHVLDVGK